MQRMTTTTDGVDGMEATDNFDVVQEQNFTAKDVLHLDDPLASNVGDINSPDEEFSIEKLIQDQDLYSVDGRRLQVTEASSLGRSGLGAVVKRIVQLICQSCKSLETLTDVNFEKFVYCLLGLGTSDRMMLGKHFAEIVTNVQYVLLPELETKFQGQFSEFVNEKRTSMFGNICFACDFWPKRSLLWATSISQDFQYRKVFVGSAAEKMYNADFLRKLLTACGLEATRQIKIVANEECATFHSEAEPCILDNIRRIFVDFFNYVKTDEQFMQSLLFFYNLSANDPSDEDATMEISLDLDFTIALAKSYPGLASEITIEDGKPSLDTFFGLIQPFIDCIDSLTVETNPTINEVHLWMKKLENVFDRPRASDPAAKQLADVFGELIKTSFLTSDAQKVAVFFDPNFKSMKFLNEAEKQEVLTIVRSRFEHLKPAVPKVKKEVKSLPSTKKFAEFADVDDEVVETPCDINYEIRRYIDHRLDRGESQYELDNNIFSIGIGIDVKNTNWNWNWN
jgi:hypothetical protein